MIRKPRTNIRVFPADHNEYGAEVLFTLGDWEIHAMSGIPHIAEAFHICDRGDETGVGMHWSYQGREENSKCPGAGCDAVQPDEIQGMVAMFNMDNPQRQWGKTVFDKLLEDDMREGFMRNWEEIALKGNGFFE